MSVEIELAIGIGCVFASGLITGALIVLLVGRESEERRRPGYLDLSRR